MLRYLTAGESHGKALVAILEGCPANLALTEADINRDLERRQQGYGRGQRMKLEADKVELTSGVRNGKTIGSPIALRIPNKSTEFFDKVITQLRPGHADLAGVQKYNKKEARDILERASARETTAKVAVGAVAKKLLSEFKINVFSKVLQIGNAIDEAARKEAIDKAAKEGDSLGGIFDVSVTGMPIGLKAEAPYGAREAELGAGDTLLLYTDGITEALDPDDREYGLARLTGICREHRREGLEEIARRLAADLDRFARGEPFADDRTVVMARRRESAS